MYFMSEVYEGLTASNDQNKRNVHGAFENENVTWSDNKFRNFEQN